MRLRRALLTATAAAFVASVTALVGADDPLASLNRTIQERFKNVDRNFGLRRIVVLGDTPHQFRPQNVSESAAVKDLDDAGLHVAFYLAGRRVLEREPHLLTKEPTLLDRRVIFGPIAVTNPESSAGLPEAVDLIDESRAAFSTLEKRERHDFDFGTWKFSARAVRAIGQECVTCHHDRAVGDPLGVVLYAYRSRN